MSLSRANSAAFEPDGGERDDSFENSCVLIDDPKCIPQQAFEIDTTAVTTCDQPFFFKRNHQRSIMLHLGLAMSDATPTEPGGTSDAVEVYTKITDEACETIYLSVFFGVGLFDLEKAVANCGLIPGTLAIQLLAALHCFLGHRFVEVPDQIRKNLATFGDVAKACLCRAGWNLVCLLVILNWASRCSLYLIQFFIGLGFLLGGDDASCVTPQWKVVTGICLIPLAFKTGAKDLQKASLVSLYLMYGIVALELSSAIIHCMANSQLDNTRGIDLLPLDARSLWKGIRKMILPFSGLAMLPYIISEMLRPEDAKKMITSVSKKASALYTVKGVVCYFSWGNAVKKRNVWTRLYDLGGTYSLVAWLIIGLFTIRTLANWPILFWPLGRETDAYLSFDKRKAVELKLPWAIECASRAKKLLRIGLVALILMPTFATAHYEDFRSFSAACLNCEIELFFPSLFAVVAVCLQEQSLRKSADYTASESSQNIYLFNSFNIHRGVTGTLAVALMLLCMRNVGRWIEKDV